MSIKLNQLTDIKLPSHAASCLEVSEPGPDPRFKNQRVVCLIVFGVFRGSIVCVASVVWCTRGPPHRPVGYLWGSRWANQAQNRANVYTQTEQPAQITGFNGFVGLFVWPARETPHKLVGYLWGTCGVVGGQTLQTYRNSY